MGILPSHFGSTCSWLQAQREHVGVGAFTPDRSFKRYAEFELSTRLRHVLRCKLNFDLGLFSVKLSFVAFALTMVSAASRSFTSSTTASAPSTISMTPP